MNPHLDELISLCKHPATVVQEAAREANYGINE